MPFTNHLARLAEPRSLVDIVLVFFVVFGFLAARRFHPKTA